MMPLRPLLLVLLFVRLVSARNDWSVPCTSGVCEYSLPSSSGPSGSLKIWGSVDSISDITTAAGWEIMDCSPDELAQDIRLVCGNTASNSSCAHLQQNDAVGKVVRLPENCGKSAFARVAKVSVSENQTIPSSLAAQFEGQQPEVLAMRLDANFSEIDYTKHGPVNFALLGANIPGVSDIDIPVISTRSRVAVRGVGDFVGNAIGTIKNVTTSAVNSIENGLSDLNNVSVNKTIDLKPINVNKTFNIINEKVSCPPIDAEINADADADAHAYVALGVAASGTIVPPKLDNFSLTAGLTANIDGSITLNANATGTIDSGKILLFSVGIPGLDLPGILSIGPTFDINAEAKGSLGVGVDLNVGVSYSINNAQLTFPPDGSNGNSSAFQLDDTPLKLSITPSGQVNGSAELHLIPTLNLGINALSDVAKANIFLDLDASASLIASLDAQGPELGTSIGRSLQNRRRSPYGRSLSAAGKRGKASSQGLTTSSTAQHADTSASASMSSTTTASAVASSSSDVNSSSGNNIDLNGCVEVDAGLAVDAGADADFFGLFDKSTQVTLFSKNFQLFKKCFGTSIPVRRAVPPHLQAIQHRKETRARRKIDLYGRDDGLTCPSANELSALKLVDDVISGKSVKDL